jgi:hypothetical protein
LVDAGVGGGTGVDAIVRGRVAAIPEGLLAGVIVWGVAEDADLLLVEGVDPAGAEDAEIVGGADDGALGVGGGW